MSDLLRTKLSAVRRKSAIVGASSGACLAFTAIVGAIGLEMIADWSFELPFILRAAWLAAALAMFAVLIGREVIWPLLKLPDEDEVALWVEHDSPGLRSRLIAAIQLSRAQAIPAGQSVSLVGALVRETEEIAGPMDFLGVVKLDRLARLGSVASFAFILSTLGMALGGTRSVDLLERAMLVPGVEVPRKTQVRMITPNPLVIAIGEDVELRAEASGVIPTVGSVLIHYEGGSGAVTLPMPADSANAKQFVLKLTTVPGPFTYRVFLNDGHSPDRQVVASIRPSVASLQIGEIYPAYTHLPPAALSPGDLRILAGSRLAIRLTANKLNKNTNAAATPFNRVTFHRATGNVDVPLSAEGGDGKTLIAKQGDDPDIAIPLDATGMSIHLVDQDGLQTKDPAVYQIQVIPDQPPTIHVTYPDRKEQLSTVRAQLLIGIEASDDFALGKLTLHYRVLPPELAQTMANQDGSAPESAPPSAIPLPPAVSGEIPLDLRGTPSDFRGRFQFELDKLSPPPLEHGAVEWWLEADDTNDVTGPGKTVTDHYLTRIGTEAEVRSDLFASLGNHMGEIKETAETQKQDNADLGEMIQEKVGAPPP